MILLLKDVKCQQGCCTLPRHHCCNSSYYPWAAWARCCSHTGSSSPAGACVPLSVPAAPPCSCARGSPGRPAWTATASLATRTRAWHLSPRIINTCTKVARDGEGEWPCPVFLGLCSQDRHPVVLSPQPGVAVPLQCVCGGAGCQRCTANCGEPQGWSQKGLCWGSAGRHHHPAQRWALPYTEHTMLELLWGLFIDLSMALSTDAFMCTTSWFSG